MFKRYRILEVDGKFIPQFKTGFFESWVSTGKLGRWYGLKYQIEYCSKETVEEARAVLEQFIEKNKKPITKIHKY